MRDRVTRSPEPSGDKRPSCGEAPEEPEIDSRAAAGHAGGMKYKRIPSFLHNFTDSFMSLVNYAGDGYAADAVMDFLRETGCGKLEVRWLPSLEMEAGGLSENAESAIARYARWIPDLAASMGVDSARIADMRTVFSVFGKGIRADTSGRDDRGRVFSTTAKFWE